MNNIIQNRKHGMKSLSLIFFIALSMLVGCNNQNIKLTDGDNHLTEEIHHTISEHIIEHYKHSYPDVEKLFEVHKIYGTSSKKDIMTIYFYSYFGGFNQSTGLENLAGHSLPAVMKVKKEKDGNFKVIDYMEPRDGNEYPSSLKKMMPEKYLKLAQNDSGNLQDLMNEMDKKVELWISDKNNKSANQDDIPAFIQSEKDIVDMHGDILNLDKFFSFIENVNQGTKDKIRVVRYTEEGDPMIHDLDYDGKSIHSTTDTRRDKFGFGSIDTSSCESITITESIDRTDYDLTGCDNTNRDNSILTIWD